MTITINIDESILKEIKTAYGNSNYDTVEGVVNDIFYRYLNQEYFDLELSIEKHEGNDIESFISNEIREQFNAIFISNGYNDLLFDETLFSSALKKEDFSISEYSIGRIYALSEIYFKLRNKVNPYGKLVELIVGYDAKWNTNLTIGLFGCW